MTDCFLFTIVNMAEAIQPLEDLVKKATDLFKKEFGSDPTHGAVAPGRVNLIGEHTDYNDGFVLPMALPMVTVALATPNQDGQCRLTTNRYTYQNLFFQTQKILFFLVRLVVRTMWLSSSWPTLRREHLNGPTTSKEPLPISMTKTRSRMVLMLLSPLQFL